MKSLDQLRAANALAASAKYDFAGKNQGEVVKKVPTMIRENGVLAALAFAVENDGKSGHANVFRAVIDHLATPGVDRLKQACSPEQLVQFLTESEQATASRLRAITGEVMAYLSYLRRFAKRKEG